MPVNKSPHTVVITVKPRRKRLELPRGHKVAGTHGSGGKRPHSATQESSQAVARPVAKPKRQNSSKKKRATVAAKSDRRKMVESLREEQQDGRFGGMRTLRKFAESYPRTRSDKQKRKVDIMITAWQGGAPGLKSQK